MASETSTVDSKKNRDRSKLSTTTKNYMDFSKSKSLKKSSSSLLIVSAYIYVPVLLLAGIVQYFGGANETLIAGMSLMFHHYGFFQITFFGSKVVHADTEYGKVKGFTSSSREGREFYEFLGIPYASPPLGKLRFQPPVPPKSWEGVRDATGYGPMCSQYDLFLQGVMGSEDCLTLNIYTPKLNNTDGKLLPVMLFIHGGMYHFGRAMDFRGHHFMDEEIIVVSINYRLQAFGFLNTGDGIVRGNMGLKDQVMALRWVQENIKYFGGDRKSVTIWGESAGGASTHLHTLSPMSKGLFARAISQSGFSLAHWSFIRKPKEQAKIFAKTLNCPTHSSYEMVECLRGISAGRIAEIFRGNHDVLHPRLDVFAPTIESGFPSENDTETFLAEHPRDILRRGDIVTKVPMLNGVNSHEGLIYAGYFVRNETIVDELNNRWSTHAPVLFDYEDLPRNEKYDVSNKIWHFYLGNKTAGMDSLYDIVDLFSDTSFNKPLEETAVLFSKAAPLYLYHYSHKGEFGVAQAYFRVSLKFPILVEGLFATALQIFNKHVLGIEEPHFGSCHADEMALLFKMHPFLSNINPGHKEYEFSKKLVKTWSHFATTGKPLPVDGHEWEAVKAGEPLKFMELDSENSPGMIEAPWKKRVQFLNSLRGLQCIEPKNITTAVCF